MQVSEAEPNGTERPTQPLTFAENPELQIECEGGFAWNITSYSKMSAKEYSPPFTIGNHQFRLLFYPRGNEPYIDQSVSLYLALDLSSESPPEWAVCAQIMFSISDPTNSRPPLTKTTQHRYCENEQDWGYSSFCPLSLLINNPAGSSSSPSEPLVQNDSLIISAQVRIIRDQMGILWHNFINYNSKKITGHVGLANQGATCYMNSLLQSLYFTNAFRKAIYMVPTEGEKPIENNALALQRIFWRLQHDEHAVSTQELTKAFGWETLESFIQSDVQEFSRVLMDELEKKFKGTGAEGMIEKLFVGKVRNVIQCLNVPFASKRTESFYDLQVTVKDVTNLKESFEAYVKAEMLTGDNKYAAEGFGLQDAKRFVEFEQFPPVLHLHLERYTFDPQVLATVKINDRLEFPLKINLNQFLASDSPQKDLDQTFILQSVFVHSGDSHGGHYYVYIRDLSNHGVDNDQCRWLKFDDTKVVPATEKEAVEDNFGGVESGVSPSSDAPVTRSMVRSRAERYKHFTNAYMLVYIRESDLEWVLCPVKDAQDIPTHIGQSIRSEDEVERQRRLERQQTQMLVKVHILTEDNLRKHEGFDSFNFDNKNHPLTPNLVLRVNRTESIGSLRERLAKELPGPRAVQRFWVFSARRNKTVRLDEFISAEDEAKPISHFFNRIISQNHFVLFADESPEPPENSITILFKFYDPEHTKVTPVAHLSVLPDSTIDSIYGKLREIVGLPRHVPLEFYEEIKPGRVDLLNPAKTFGELQFCTGDIICFQLAAPVLTQQSRLPKVSDYFRELQETVYVQFKLADGTELVNVRLALSIAFSDLVAAVAEKLDASPSNVRLRLATNDSDSSPTTEMAVDDSIPLKSTSTTLYQAVSSIIPESYYTDGIVLICEKTPIPVIDMESMKRIKIVRSRNLLNSSNDPESIVYIGPKDSLRTIWPRIPTELTEGLDPTSSRLVETVNHRVLRDYLEDDLLASLGETSEVYLEGGLDPLELEPPSPQYRLISVFSYTRDTSRVHSRPFRLLLFPNEPFSETKKRLFARLNHAFSNTDKWTFNIVAHGKARPIQDDEILAQPGLLSTHDQLGINRPDPSPEFRSPLASGIERSIKIRSSTPK